MAKTLLVNGKIVRTDDISALIKINQDNSQKFPKIKKEQKKEEPKKGKKISLSFRCGDIFKEKDLDTNLSKIKDCANIVKLSTLIFEIKELLVSRYFNIVPKEQVLNYVNRLIEEVHNNPNIKYNVNDEEERNASLLISEYIEQLSLSLKIDISLDLMDTSRDEELAREMENAPTSVNFINGKNVNGGNGENVNGENGSSSSERGSENTRLSILLHEETGNFKVIICQARYLQSSLRKASAKGYELLFTTTMRGDSWERLKRSFNLGTINTRTLKLKPNVSNQDLLNFLCSFSFE